jgi:hypothetical protein
MSWLTVFLARLVGLFSVFIAAAYLIRGSAVIETTVADGSVMLVYAMISVAIGVAMILGHNVWSGGVLPVVVTLVGWLILAKGLVLLFLSPQAMMRILQNVQYHQHFYLYLVPATLIGLYLTWGGFNAPMSRKL